MSRHTILLLQRLPNKSSRTFSEHETTELALESILNYYEGKLKELNPTARDITYEISDLHGYLDKYADICALVFDPQLKAYVPRDRQWIKDKVYHLLNQKAR
jgi:hypothetical protein